MPYSEEKLLKFKNIIFEDIENNIKDLMEKKLKFEKETLEKTKKQAMKKNFLNIEKEIKDIKRNYKYELTKKLFEKRKELLIFRNNLVENIIALSKKKILDFTKTEKYNNQLKENIKECIKKYGCTNFEILLRKEDIKKLEKAHNIFADSDNALGGFKIFDIENKVEIDETFDYKLTIAIKNFYKKSELILNFF